MGVAIVGGVLVASVLLAGFVLPKHVTVGRRVVIDAPLELVWPDLTTASVWPEWAGEAAPEITEIKLPTKATDTRRSIKYKTELDGRLPIEGRVELTGDGTRTAIAWMDSMYFAHDYLGRYRGAAANYAYGPKLEKNLLALKTRAEERARAKNVVAMPAPQAHDPALTPPPDEPKTTPPPGEPPPPPVDAPPGEPPPKPVEKPTEPPPAPSPVQPPPETPVEKPIEKPAEPPPAEVEPPPPEKPAEPAPP